MNLVPFEEATISRYRQRADWERVLLARRKALALAHARGDATEVQRIVVRNCELLGVPLPR